MTAGRSGLAAAVAGLVLLLAASPGSAQDAGDDPAADRSPPAAARTGDTAAATAEGGAPGGPVPPDSADAIRASLERPPAEHPLTAGDVVGFPLKVAALPLRLAFDGLAAATGWLLVPERYQELREAYRDVRALGLRPAVGTSTGTRSGVGASLGYVGLRPLVLEVGGTVRGYQRHRIGLEWAAGPWAAEVGFQFQRQAQEHFWGLGMEAPPALRSDFLWDQVGPEAAISLRPSPSLSLRLSTGAEENEVGPGFDDGRPDLLETFDPDRLFGARHLSRFWRVGLEAGLDRTRWRDLQIRGYRLGLEARRYVGVEETPSDFTRLALRAQGYLPLTDRHLVALRGRVEASRGSGRGVPFFHLPWLGGESLRSHETGRLRDHDLLAGGVEWRYEVWRDIRPRGRVEGFVFWEEGSAGRRLDELPGSESSYGFGLLLGWSRAVRATTWVAFGGPDTRISASLSAPYGPLTGRRP